MTTQQLIAELQKLPPDTEINAYFYEDGFISAISEGDGVFWDKHGFYIGGKKVHEPDWERSAIHPVK